MRRRTEGAAARARRGRGVQCGAGLVSLVVTVPGVADDRIDIGPTIIDDRVELRPTVLGACL